MIPAAGGGRKQGKSQDRARSRRAQGQALSRGLPGVLEASFQKDEVETQQTLPRRVT